MAGQSHDHHHDVASPQDADHSETSWRTKVRDRQAWGHAATAAVGDVTMLRRELAVGYLVAGFLAALVPVDAWNAVFLHGHGFWTTLENVVVGPFIAMIAFVCSVGNVPLAAALWHGGISFGGVVSFIFGDLITLPLLMIYRRIYGSRAALKMLVLFWFVMSLAGLVTEGIFRVAGLVPTSRSTQVVPEGFAWNATTILNIVALVVAAVVYWAYRHAKGAPTSSGAPGCPAETA